MTSQHQFVGKFTEHYQGVSKCNAREHSDYWVKKSWSKSEVPLCQYTAPVCSVCGQV